MKVSVITINYNHSKQLEATIRSVVGNAKMLGNAFEEEVEYIVIDGGSTDSSACVIRRYSEYISYWVSEADNGIYNAMNKGISVARGEYCLFLNSGDTFYEKDTLKKVLPCLDTDFVCGNAVLKYAGGMGCTANGRCLVLHATFLCMPSILVYSYEHASITSI